VCTIDAIPLIGFIGLGYEISHRVYKKRKKTSLIFYWGEFDLVFQLCIISHYNITIYLFLTTDTLIKNKIKFSSYVRKFRWEQLHTAQSYMWKGFLLYEEMGKYTV
jgi:hypothetical protein